MKIHFVGDLSGNKHDYQKIIAKIKNLGYELISDHSVTKNLSDIKNETPEEAELYIKKMNRWMKTADIVLFETTLPYLGAGFEVSYALQLGKPVIVLYKPNGQNTPYILRGINNKKLQVVSYNDNILDEVLKESLLEAQEYVDVRFNFFISPEIGSYLDWISKNKRIPRAVYLRHLIEEDMKNNQEYNQEV